MTKQPSRDALLQRIAELEACVQALRGGISKTSTAGVFSLVDFEHAADGICVCHAIETFPHVRFTFWNRRMVDLTGYELHDINRKGWYQSLYPDPAAQAEAKARMAAMRAGVDLQAEEWEITRADGEKRTLRISTSILAHGDNNPRIMAIMHDVTAQHRVETALKKERQDLRHQLAQQSASLADTDRALKHSDTRYRALFESASDALFIENDRDQILDVNPKACALLGYRREELLNMTVADIQAPECRGERGQVLCRELREHQGKPFEAVDLHKDGSRIPVEVTNTRIDDKGLVLSIVRDIRERKAVEQTRREAYEIIAKSPIVAFLWQNTPEWRVEYVSPNADRIFGYSAEDFISGRVVYRSVVHAADFDRVAREVKTYSQESDREEFTHEPYRILAQDGTIRWVNDHTFIRRNPQGAITHYQGILEDITERQHINKELIKMEKLQSLGVLAGGIAHDFNNFLTGILGNLSLAKLDIHTTDPVARILEEMEKAAVRAKDLTQQLLTFSKGGAPVKRTVRIADLVGEAAQFVLRGSNVRCALQIDENLRPSEVDEGQITQVLHNLIINADQAMPEGGVVYIRGINVSLSPDNSYALTPGDYIQLTIADQGLGIKSQHIKKVFDPYFTTKQKGSGLGLAVAYSIVSKHDGQLSVDSKIGEGSTFTILLPAVDSATIETRWTHPQLISGRGRILVMDDEDFIRDLAARVLEKMGYTVALAQDGRTAVAMYREALAAGDKFDAVILDLTVPGGMGGKDTVRRLKAIDPHVRALVSSGYSNDPVMASYQDYGFCGAVQKPYRVQEIGNLLNQIIGA